MGSAAKPGIAEAPEEPSFVRGEFADGFDVHKRGDITEIVFWKNWVYDQELGPLATRRIVVGRAYIGSEAFERDASRACQGVPLNARKFITFPGVQQ